jgi:hypothetical protein
MRMVNAERRFVQFDDTAHRESYQVSPQPAASLHTGQWNTVIADAAEDYPESLDFGLRQNTPLDIRYESRARRVWSNWVKETWVLDRNGRVAVTRDVQFCGGSAAVFDLDEFVRSVV